MWWMLAVSPQGKRKGGEGERDPLYEYYGDEYEGTQQEEDLLEKWQPGACVRACAHGCVGVGGVSCWRTGSQVRACAWVWVWVWVGGWGIVHACAHGCGW